MNYHQEKILSAIERYQKETIRVLGVLESVLSKQDWLVGGKCTIADLSFITYAAVSHSLTTPLTFSQVEPGGLPLHTEGLPWHQCREGLPCRQQVSSTLDRIRNLGNLFVLTCDV